VNDAPSKIRDILSNIQYFHECETAARDSGEPQIMAVNEEPMEVDEDIPHLPETTGQGDTDFQQINPMPTQDDIHAQLAVEMAKQAGVFADEECEWNVTYGAKARMGTVNDLQLLQEWKDQMERDVETLNQAMTIVDEPQDFPDGAASNRDNDNTGARVIPLSDHEGNTRMIEERTVEASELALTSVDPSMLKDDQYHAYDIITSHLEETLAGSNPPPLRLVIHGEGGTGKSKVIQTVTQFFLCKGAGYMLLKSAYTGIAASLIEGKTTHSIAMISQSKASNTLSEERKQKLQNFWKHYTYLVIDEMSMISKSFLALLSRIIGIGKGTDGNTNPAESFGGINVILSGDFHQFPPVAAASNEALYFPSDADRDSVDALLGRQIYEEFRTVVILKQQIRCTDPEWLDFLQHL